MPQLTKPILKIIAAFLVVIIILVASLFSISSQLILPAPGKVLPAKEWVVFRDNGDQIVSRLTDHKRGVIVSQATFPVVRGDNLHFNLADYSSSTGMVHSGDTLAHLSSPDFQIWKQDLLNQQQDLAAQLKLAQAGDKPELIRQAENELNLAEEEENFQSRQLSRQKELFAKNMISSQEFELTESAWRLAKAKKEVQQAALDVYRTGEKPELINQIKTQIEGVNRQLTLLPTREQAFTIITPIDGRLFPTSASVDTLVWVGSDPDWIIKVPIDYRYKSLVLPGQEVQIKTVSGDELGNGKITSVGQQAVLLAGQQVIEAIVIVEGEINLAPGLYLEIGIKTGSATWWDQLIFSLNRPRH